MTNLKSLGIGPSTEVPIVAATLTAIQTKLERLADMQVDEWSLADLLDYSQLMIYQELLTALA
ncbi:hypothetical protein M2401_006852 [Pseudomonas sp. JUb42]|uniref:hypothetical protein n=1 Tax=Pseudomonas sp. JUb42 TaxID=2940611 RepID=UPI0021692B8C|nr:hypothetical protein [Pseudomonas sp. JUb42]MCS3473084.1 hypothetical protein [Pseudomonas sp. JUb42]